MRRREFIALLGGITSLWPFELRSQQASRIGYLAPVVGRTPGDEAFEASLQELGWVPDRNLKIEYRYTGGRQDTIAPVVAEVAALGLDCLVVWGRQIALPLMQAAPQTPIVFIVTDLDPIEAGLVSNVAHPGGNVTGITTANLQVMAKRLELLKEAVPTLTRVAVLFSTERNRSSTAIDALAAAGRALSVNLDEIEVKTPLELQEALNSARGRGAQGLYIWPTGFAYSYAQQISDVANANGLPSIHPFREGARSGALLGYAADLREHARRAAALTDRILRGIPPGSLAVEQTSKYQLVVNLKTAKALGLAIPPTLLALADELIE